MIFTELIKEQAVQSIIMFSAGLGLGMLHQVWEIFRNAAVRRADAAREARIKARDIRIAQKTERKRKPKKQRRPRRNENSAAGIHALSAVLEFAFWPFAAFFVSEFVYYAAYGDLSFHNFLALGLGVLLWRKAFYDIVY